MKQLLTAIAIICLTSFTAQAQNKPSKEETIKFIVSVLKQMDYMRWDDGGGIDHFESFSGSDLSTKRYENGNLVSQTTLGDVKWESFKSFDFYVTPNCSACINIVISFSTPFKQIINNYSRGKTYSDTNDHFDYYLPSSSKDRMPSLKKAFERLKEIAQEENKDPFAN